MLTVSISINGKALYTRTVVNTLAGRGGIAVYRCDDGSMIKHRPAKGAVRLAIEALKTIKE